MTTPENKDQRYISVSYKGGYPFLGKAETLIGPATDSHDCQGARSHMSDVGLSQVLEKIYKERGFDFRQYKESTLKRRLARRLKATKSTSYQEYLAVLDAPRRIQKTPR